MKKSYLHRILLLVLLLTVSILSTGCTPQEAAAPTPASISPATTQPTASPVPTSTPILPQPRLYIDPVIPDFYQESLTLPANWEQTEEADAANLTLSINTQQPQTRLIYALVAPFNTIDDNITSTDLRALWQGTTPAIASAQHLLVSRSTLNAFEALWGPPSSKTVTFLNQRQFSQRAWRKENHWAILPFQDLDAQWKVIAVDDQSPIHKGFAPTTYALTLPVALQQTAPIDEAALEALTLPPSNYDPEKLVTVNLTGVTALVRATAGLMEYLGTTYPATDIRDILIEADITHINNEVPFSPSCPLPVEYQTSLVFCSRPDYIELLEDIGADVIELSGDHFQDWGPDAVRYTLDMYNQRGWHYYGGGADLDDAQQPALFEIKGTKLAFLGCNAKPKGYARASETNPGAMHCDMDWMTEQVTALSEDGYLPIVTFQHLEYYSYEIHPILQEDFRKMADAGAVIVSGSQAHIPQAVELYEESFLHYGLGNLFFDQYNESKETRQAFIDRHVFYNGEHIATELLTIEFTDYAHSQPMSLESRQSLLDIIFDVSLWDWN